MASSFLDTSALVKRYHVEEGTGPVDLLFDTPDHGLIISRLGFVEMLSALALKVRVGVLSVEDHDLARKRFLGDVKSRRILVVRMLVPHFREAERLIGLYAKSHRFRTLDALQLGVAVNLHRDGRIDRFVCADRVLCEIALHVGIETMNPIAT